MRNTPIGNNACEEICPFLKNRNVKCTTKGCEIIRDDYQYVCGCDINKEAPQTQIRGDNDE